MQRSSETQDFPVHVTGAGASHAERKLKKPSMTCQHQRQGGCKCGDTHLHS